MNDGFINVEYNPFDGLWTLTLDDKTMRDVTTCMVEARMHASDRVAVLVNEVFANKARGSFPGQPEARR